MVLRDPTGASDVGGNDFMAIFAGDANARRNDRCHPRRGREDRPDTRDESVHVVDRGGSTGHPAGRAGTRSDAGEPGRPDLWLHGRGTQLLAEVEVDEAGSVAVELRPDHTTTFEAVRPEDDLHAVATARVRVSVQAQVDGELRGFYAMSSGTALYHPGENPRYHLHVAPNSTGMAAPSSSSAGHRMGGAAWPGCRSSSEGGASC